MHNRVLPRWRKVSVNLALGCLCVGFLLCQTTVATFAAEPAAGKSASLATSVPSGAVGYAEISRLGDLLKRIQDSSYLQMALASPQYQALQKQPQYKQGDAVRKIIETQVGMDLWKLFEELLRDRVAVAVYPKAGAVPGAPAADVLAIVRGVEPKVLAQLRERIDPLLTLAQEQLVPADPIEGAPANTTVISFKGQVLVALGDSWVVAASTRDLLTKAVGLLAGKGQGTLADDAPFRAMTDQMGKDHLVRAFVNAEFLTKAKGSRLTPEKLDNPLVSMFLGGITELAAGSPYAGLALDVEEDRFVLTTGIAGDSRKLDDAHRVFFSDPDGPGTAAIPQLPSLIAGFTFHLDLANWYKQREKLLEARLLPAFDQFETGIANLLPGKDVGEDVMPLIGKSLTFVAAPQDYSHIDGKPGVKLPGFAIIVDLAKPEEGGDLFQMFFQTFSAIVNLGAAQQNNQPWVMTSETFKDVQIAYGRYLKRPTGDQLPLVYNFMPASARMGNKFIICSSLATCRQLVEALKQPDSGGQRPNRNLNFEFHPSALADILQANKEVFTARAIQQGQEAKQAEGEFATSLQLLRFFDSFRLSSRVLSEGFQVQFEGSWK